MNGLWSEILICDECGVNDVGLCPISEMGYVVAYHHDASPLI